MSYVLGLDVGIASLGWAVVKQNTRILDAGVRIFTKAEQPKTGESLAKPRRDARGLRRTTRRRAQRLKDLKTLFQSHKIDTSLLGATGLHMPDPWKLRTEGLDRQLNSAEWAVVLFHICKHRGYRSNGQIIGAERDKWNQILSLIPKDLPLPHFNLGVDQEDDTSEKGIINKALVDLQAKQAEGNYRTLGELIFKSPEFANRKHNAPSDYKITMARADLAMEMHLLFKTQRDHGNPHTSHEFEGRVIWHLIRQRPFADRDQIERMIGHCTFERSEKRAAKYAPSSEIFTLLSDINNLQVRIGSGSIELTPQQKQNIFDYCWDKIASKPKKDGKGSLVTYAEIRKVLKMSQDKEANDKFNKVRYSPKLPIAKSEKVRFAELRGLHQLYSHFKDLIDSKELTTIFETLDPVAWILTICKNESDLKSELTQLNIEADLIKEIIANPPKMDQVMSLSTKAIRKIIIPMLSWARYDQACLAVGYHHSDLKPKGDLSNVTKLEFNEIDFEDIRNPVVLRSISQARKQINAIFRKYGRPDSIHIELARDLQKDFKERGQITKKQNDNARQREEREAKFTELYEYSPSGLELAKFRLFEEQNGHCFYSNTQIDPSRLNEPGYVDIDHIIPYSRSANDSLANKILCLASENRQKGNQTPYEYFGHDTQRWHAFEQSVLTHFGKYFNKRDNLLCLEWTIDQANKFKSRSLNDTRYIAKFIKQYLTDKLNIETLPINGQMTAFLRSRWGLNKDRSAGDQHHAVDAIVTACASYPMVNRVMKYSKLGELKYQKLLAESDEIIKEGNEYIDTETGEVIEDKFPLPWENFRQDIFNKLKWPYTFKSMQDPEWDGIIISRPVQKKVSGAAHQETTRSAKKFNDGIVISKKPLESFKLNKKGELEPRIYDLKHNQDISDLIKSRLIEYSNDSKKAFIEPLYRLTKSGEQGPLISKVKVEENKSTGVFVQPHLENSGIADNDSMVRVDVFTKDNKYFLVPIYVADTKRPNLPNKAITQKTPENKWPEMSPEYEFLFSLQSNDLVYLKLKDKDFFGFYKSTHRGVGTIQIEDLMRINKVENPGVKTAIEFRKYQIDLLGHISEVKNETRQKFSSIKKSR